MIAAIVAREIAQKEREEFFGRVVRLVGIEREIETALGALAETKVLRHFVDEHFFVDALRVVLGEKALVSESKSSCDSDGRALKLRRESQQNEKRRGGPRRVSAVFGIWVVLACGFPLT